MTPPTAERELLLGLLAVHVGLLQPDQLSASLGDWARDRSQSLGGILCQRQLLDAAEQQALDRLVQALLRRPPDQIAHLLTALLPDDLVAGLVGLNDAVVNAWLASLGKGPAAVTVDHPGFAAHAEMPTVQTGGPGVSGLAPPPGTSHVRYHIVRPHARGGLGEIFVALDEELQREVALKEMQQRHLDRPDSRARFLLEGEITGKLEHPGIVPVYGLGVYADGRPYYAMRFIRGESLSQAIRRYHAGAPADPGARAIELRTLLARFVAVCNAVEYAHSKGVLHRDLKPENVMLGPYGETLVVDWGLARSPSGEVASANGLHQPAADSTEGSRLPPAPEEEVGQVVGTPQYMPPEQAAGRVDELGPASDVYALGATLYHLLTGQAPFPAERNLVRLLRLVQSGAWTPPRQVNPAVPRALDAVCCKAMAAAPAERYASAKELADDVERWLADEPVRAFREPWPARLARWARHHRTTVITAAVVCLTVVVALSIGSVLLVREQHRTEKAIEERALVQVDALLEADPQAVPAILQGLEPVRDLVRGRLRQVRQQPEPSGASEEELARHRRHQTRAGLALLADDPDEAAFLRQRLVHVKLDPGEALLLRDALASRGPEMAGDLWAEVDRPTASAQQRFRALVALAQFDPDNPRWEDDGPLVVAPMLQADPLHVGTWTQALRPVRKHLIGTLSEVFSDPKLPAERRVAATILREYAADDPDLLVDLLGRAGPEQILLLLPRLREQRDTMMALLRRATQKQHRPASDDERDALARARANHAAALLLLGDPEPVWNALRHGPYPDVRSQLIHLLPALEVDADVLVRRLLRETDDGVRRALVLTLGGYTAEQLPEATRKQLVPKLLAWYRKEPDPGLHGAIDWLLRNGQEGERSRKFQWDQGAALEKIDQSLRGSPPAGRRWYVAPCGETMVVLGPDTFRMGSPEMEAGHDSDEKLHDRRIDRRFAVAAREVTVRQFRRFLAANPKLDHAIRRQYSPEEDCPVVSVTFYEAAQFCRWLSEQEDVPREQMCFPPVDEIEKHRRDKTPLPLPADYLKRTGYRLPTEAEWEYACRARSLTSRPHGVSNELMSQYAWDVYSALERTWPVGQKKPNDFGLFDMHGNVAEWCLDLYAAYLAPGPGGFVDDVERVREINPDSKCILRGAPFHPRPTPLRSAYRYWHVPGDQFSTVGLRIARTMP